MSVRRSGLPGAGRAPEVLGRIDHGVHVFGLESLGRSRRTGRRMEHGVARSAPAAMPEWGTGRRSGTPVGSRVYAATPAHTEAASVMTMASQRLACVPARAATGLFQVGWRSPHPSSFLAVGSVCGNDMSGRAVAVWHVSGGAQGCRPNRYAHHPESSSVTSGEGVARRARRSAFCLKLLAFSRRPLTHQENHYALRVCRPCERPLTDDGGMN